MQSHCYWCHLYANLPGWKVSIATTSNPLVHIGRMVPLSFIFIGEELGSEKWSNFTLSVFLNTMSCLCISLYYRYQLQTKITEFKFSFQKLKTDRSGNTRKISLFFLFFLLAEVNLYNRKLKIFRQNTLSITLMSEEDTLSNF